MAQVNPARLPAVAPPRARARTVIHPERGCLGQNTTPAQFLRSFIHIPKQRLTGLC